MYSESQAATKTTESSWCPSLRKFPSSSALTSSPSPCAFSNNRKWSIVAYWPLIYCVLQSFLTPWHDMWSTLGFNDIVFAKLFFVATLLRKIIDFSEQPRASLIVSYSCLKFKWGTYSDVVFPKCAFSNKFGDACKNRRSISPLGFFDLVFYYFISATCYFNFRCLIYDLFIIEDAFASLTTFGIRLSPKRSSSSSSRLDKSLAGSSWCCTFSLISLALLPA